MIKISFLHHHGHVGGLLTVLVKAPARPACGAVASSTRRGALIELRRERKVLKAGGTPGTDFLIFPRQRRTLAGN